MAKQPLLRITLIVTSALALGGLATVVTGGHPVPTKRVDTALRAGTDALGTTSVSPTYLPPGATLFEQVGDERFPNVDENQYQLAGAANSDTLPPGGVDETTAPTAHPATLLTVTFVPGMRSVPDLPADPAYFDIRATTVAGIPGLLTTPKSDFGVYRVDWIDSQGYHIVMCERRQTTDGTSGLPADELVRVASSLY
jgi:hypothetical protein